MSTISYPKSWVSGEILTAADLNAQFAAVNTITGITAGQLATGAVTTTSISDGSVTTVKLATGASIHAIQSVGVSLGQTTQNVELAIATLPAITTRGGRVVIFGTVAAVVSQADGANHTWEFTLYRD